MLKAIYKSGEEIPEAFRELYSERDGQWELTGVQGVKTQADVDRLTGALSRAKQERDEAKAQLDKRGEATPEKLAELEDTVAELNTKLELAGKTPEDFESKLAELADRRAVSMSAPVKRELDQARARLAELEADNGKLQSTIVNRDIDDTLREVCTKAKVLQPAVADVLMHRALFEKSDDGRFITREGNGVTPGLTPDQWLQDRQQDRSHWWAPSQGGGATGGGPGGPGGENPWSPKSWSITAQGSYIREHGAEKAEAAAKAVGSKVGATAPPTA